jgi:hypothetical protein
MNRRLRAVQVLLSWAVLAALIARGGFLPGESPDHPAPPGLLESNLEAESGELDRQLQNTDAHRELLDRLSADLIAGRRSLPKAADLLADFSRRRTGSRGPAGRLLLHPVLPARRRPEDEKSARRLAAEYRACYGVPLTLPEPAKGAAIPPWGRPARLVQDAAAASAVPVRWGAVGGREDAPG